MYAFSEQDLVTFFRGEHREVLRYIIDSARDAVSFNKDNRLMQFVELAGRSSDRPLGYMTIERTFFKEFLYKKALNVSIDDGMDQGTNARILEREQIVRLMNLFADLFLVGKWDPEIGGRRLERRVQKGDPIAELHLRAWRLTREEVLANVLRWVRLVIENYYAWTGTVVDSDRLLHQSLPDGLWKRIESFLSSLGRLPCWVDKNLSLTVFGAKQNREFWEQVFQTGKAPTGAQVLAKKLDLQEMIQESTSVGS